MAGGPRKNACCLGIPVYFLIIDDTEWLLNSHGSILHDPCGLLERSSSIHYWEGCGKLWIVRRLYSVMVDWGALSRLSLIGFFRFSVLGIW
jgi:hypothetical protein